MKIGLLIIILVIAIMIASCLPPPDFEEPVDSESFCGDGIVDLGEECDDGDLNGVVCTPPTGSTCTYCSNDCKIITLTDTSLPPPEDTMPVNSTINGEYPYGMIPGSIRYLDSTMHSISIEWDIAGDLNHNAESRVRFREVGVSEWNEFMPLLRINFSWPSGITHWSHPDEYDLNMFAGSIMFLTPGIEYELWLEIIDPDGGNATQVRTISTKPISQRSDTCTVTVNPTTFASAYSNALPGHVICLQSGSYGDFRADKPGSASGHIVLVNAPGASPTFSRIRVEADYQWIEGIHFNIPTSGGGVLATVGKNARFVVIKNNTFTGYSYSINLEGGSRYWYIVDNVIVGDRTEITGTSTDFAGEGIEVGRSEGHTIAFNTISHVGDGISYTKRNVDVFGNYIYRITDDGLEPDYGYANNRFWGNRILDSYNFAFSFQPMHSGPWYFIRNEIRQTEWTRQKRSESSLRGTLFKFSGPVDRFVLLHNTFVAENISPISRVALRPILSSYSRNNIYAVPGNPVWYETPWPDGNTAIPNVAFYDNDWRTDVDYDGFIWVGNPGFVWNNVPYNTLEAFSNAAGIQQNAIKMYHSDFVNYPTDLRLGQGTPGVNAGDKVIGVNDNYFGSAPDIGAYEHGKEIPHYGAGTRETLRERHAYWEYW